MRKSVTFWLFVASVSLFLLQLFPFTGLFLMFMGAGFLNALLIYLFLAALFIESLIGRLPRILAVVPIVIIGTNYGAYRVQQRLLIDETQTLKSINVGKVMDFDPSTESLVFEGNITAWFEHFVAHHRIPVAYAGVNAVRMAPASDCSTIKNFDNAAHAGLGGSQYPGIPRGQEPCTIRTSEKPPANGQVRVQQADHASRTMKYLGMSEPSTDVIVDGKLVGSHRQIVVYTISPYLRFVGCGLIDNPPAWKCITSLFDERKRVIDTNPPYPANNYWFGNDAEILLGIPQYTIDDILHFTGYPQNASIVALAQSPAPLPTVSAPPQGSFDPTSKITGSRLWVCRDHNCVETQPTK